MVNKTMYTVGIFILASNTKNRNSNINTWAIYEWY